MTISTLSPLNYVDTSAADTFTQKTGTIKTDDPTGSSLIFGITGATKEAKTLNGVSYDQWLKGTYGTLYLNSSNGNYLLDPITAGINAAKTKVSENFPITVDNAGVISSDNLTVSVAGVDDLPTLSGLDSHEFIAKTSVDNGVLTVDMTSKYSGWIAVGFSADPLMPATDTYLAGYDATKKLGYGFDGLVGTGKVQPPIDTQQDWTLKSATETAGWTQAVATRPLNTGDTAGDYDLSATPHYLLWSYHASDDTGTARHTGRGANADAISYQNGDDLTLIGGQLTISDGDKDAVTATVVTPAGHGKASVDSRGAWTYLLDDHQLSASQFQALSANETLNDSATFSFTAGGITLEKTVTFPIAIGTNDAPTGSLTLSGETKVGGMMTANDQISDADASANELNATRYQWQMSADGQHWQDIDGANDTHIHQVGDFLQGQQLRIVASYFDGGTHETVTSSASTKVTTTQAAKLIVSPQAKFTLADGYAAAQYTGDDHAELKGNGLKNKLTSGNGNDVLDGGGDADMMTGGAGNDSYRVDNAKDKVIEGTDNGIDSVESTLDWILGNNLENLTLLGSAKKATGNKLDNRLEGNAADNIFSGKGGHDVFKGGTGKDQFILDQKAIAQNACIIEDFTPGEDKLMLSKKIFKFVDASHLSYDETTGVLSYDADASGSKFSPVAIVTLTGTPDITSADYSLF